MWGFGGVVCGVWCGACVRVCVRVYTEFAWLSGGNNPMQNPGYATGCRPSKSCRVYSPCPGLGLGVANCGQSERRMTNDCLCQVVCCSVKVD